MASRGLRWVLSEKVGFCIADSFIYDPTLPHAGDIGGIGSCSDPTSRRGLDIGAVDEYDRTDDGQSITIDTLADGTYWLRAVVDPNNFFAEANKANNETDVLVSIIGMTVQVLQTVVPSLAPPPDITLNAPTGPLSGMVTLSAATASGGPVQILLDGQPLGAPLPVGAYTLNWNSTLVHGRLPSARGTDCGSHWCRRDLTSRGRDRCQRRQHPPVRSNHEPG